MAPVPPPPHERTWRHPAEVALTHRSTLKSERPDSTVRTFGVLSASVGFLLIGLGLLWLSPDSADDQTTSGARSPETTTSAPLATPIEVTAENSELLGLGTPPSGPVAMVSDRQVSAVAGGPATITVAGGASSIRLEVRLSDGTVTGAKVLGTRSGVALVELDQAPSQPTLRLASLSPPQSAVVLVLTEEPQSVPYGRLTTAANDDPLAYAAGTPVVSTEGELIGICVEGPEDGTTQFISVDDLLLDASAAPPTEHHPRD